MKFNPDEIANMNDMDFFFPDLVVISGHEYKCQRDISKNKVLIPYTEEPNVGIGDVIIQKSGSKNIEPCRACFLCPTFPRSNMATDFRLTVHRSII